MSVHPAEFPHPLSSPLRPARGASRRRFAEGTALAALLLCGDWASAQPVALPTISVQDSDQSQSAPYLVDKPASPKYTAPLEDTPQTVTVIPEKVIKEQNLLTLRDVLSTVPGITFGAGEGGSGYGDSVTLRGFTANTDITVDGLRDSAQYSRTDMFDIEQVEVVNGANSVYSGAGSLGGSINLVSKAPQPDNFVRASAGIGTDDYYRGTVDANVRIDDMVAARLNLMGHANDVPGRDVEDYKRWGIAPSVTVGLTTPTQATLSYFHQNDYNTPRYGVPYFQDQWNAGPLPGASTSTYYGYANLDTQQITSDIVTGKIDHEFNDHYAIHNLTRWEQVRQLTIVDPPQGTFCLANGINPATGAACATPNSYVLSGPRGNERDTVNRLVANETDFTAKFDTFGIGHTMTIGGLYTHETFNLDTGNVLRNPAGALPNPVLPNMTISGPNNIWSGPVNFIQSASQDGSQDDKALYAFETMKILPQLEINAGLRWEDSSGGYTSSAYGTNGVLTSTAPTFNQSNDLLSYRAGIVYKPAENGSLYFSYANSSTPSQTSVNGSCTSGTYGSTTFVNNCNVKPETGVNYEFGAKWTWLHEKLMTTASFFRNDRSNYKVPSNDPTVPDQQLDGHARVDGVAVSVTGQVTKEWNVLLNYTYLTSKVLQGVSDFCLSHQTAATCAASFAVGSSTPLAGNPLTQTPDHALNLWTTYDLPYDVQVGYGLTYQGRIYLNNGPGPLYTAPGYWVNNAMVSYKINSQLTAQVNVNNLFDEGYFTNIRNNGWALPGAARAAMVSLNLNL